MVMVCLSEMRELHLTIQPLYLFVVYDNELLVCWRVNVELQPSFDKNILHSHSHLDGMS